MRALIALACFACACSPSGDYEYVACTTDHDCMGRASCQTIAWRDGSGHLCTADCTGESSCPHGGRCLDVAASSAFRCYEPCAMDPDCPSGFICQPISVGGSVCLPGTP